VAASPERRWAVWLGCGLIVLSFGIYPAYPVIVFLPLPAWARGVVALGLSALSWAMFLTGSALAGGAGLSYLRRRVGWGSSAG